MKKYHSVLGWVTVSGSVNESGQVAVITEQGEQKTVSMSELSDSGMICS